MINFFLFKILINFSIIPIRHLKLYHLRFNVYTPSVSHKFKFYYCMAIVIIANNNLQNIT